MAKGRNTIVVSTRVSDQLHEAIMLAATNRRMTVSEYIKMVLGQWPELQAPGPRLVR
ncbi:MAG: hypothetical protein Q7K03_05945 [Dehalococcoidia bacterium]|nr:hypothetical protein [Dehalococcoidia bacterium]